MKADEPLRANELRINSYYQWKNDGEVFMLDLKRMSIICDFEQGDPEPCSNITGIPLSESWLERMGWVWNEACKSYEKYPNGDARMNLQERPLNGSYTMFNYVLKAMIAERIYYVHQLQNLYFALTGQELEIKEHERKG